MPKFSPYADEESLKKAMEIAELEEQLKGRIKDYKVMNTPQKRLDADQKVTGNAVYTGDIQFAGMLYARFARSTHKHAKIKSINTEKALAYPGVRAVVTYKDVPKNVYEWPAMYKALNLPKGDIPIMTDHIRYVGEPVAGVAAETEAAAEEAVKLIEVEYEELPAVTDMYEAMEPDSPKVHEGGNQAGFTSAIPVEEMHFPYLTAWGEHDKDLAESDLVVEKTYIKGHHRYGGTIELMQFIARWEGDMLIAYSATQGVHTTKVALATWLGIPQSKVRVISPYVGGAFGSKTSPFQEQPIIAILSKMTNLPVKMTSGATEYSVCARPSETSETTVKMGVKKDGTITTMRMSYLVNSGAYTDITPTLLFVGLNSATDLFHLPSCHMEGKLLFSHTIPTGGMRGFGIVQPFWAIFSAVYEACEKLNMDPLDFMLKNCVLPGERVWRFRVPTVHIKNRECLLKVAEESGWREKWHQPGTKTLPNGRKHGIGMAFVPYACGSLWIRPAIALIESNEDGTMRIITGASEIGSGQKTAFAILAAEVLNMDPMDFEVVMSDSSATPHDTEQTGNRTTQYVGNAVVMAAEEVKKELCILGSRLLDVSPDEVDVRNKIIYVKDQPQKAIPISEACVKAPFVTGKAFVVHGRGIYCVPTDVTFAGTIAVVAEVEVDAETGEVFVTHVTSAGDTGVPINSAVVESQARGSMVHGMGYTFNEEVLIDQKSQQILTPHPSPWYVLPTFKNASDMKPFISLVSYFPLGPLGAKGGTSEGGFYCIPPALTAAVFNAIGVWVDESPITPDRILKALGKVREER